MSDPRAPPGAQHFPAVVRGTSDAYAPQPSDAAAMSTHERPGDATQAAAIPTGLGAKQSSGSNYNAGFGEVFKRRISPGQGSENGNRAGRPLTTTGRYPFNDARMSASDYPFGDASTRTGGNGNGGTFASQLASVDVFSPCGGRGLPRGPVPYTLPNAYSNSQQRDVTPAGRMPSSIHVEKRPSRTNPAVWAIDEELKTAWLAHLQGKGKGEDVGSGDGA